MILRLLLSQYKTNTSFLGVKEENRHLSLVICFEEPLSKYHLELDIVKHTCIMNLTLKF